VGNKRVYPATPYVITHICALVTKYYYANGQRVAMRVEGTPYYLLTDHLGSTAITLNSSGGKIAELRYRAYGQTRYSSGTTPTNRRFTGQLEEGTIGLYDYGARFYDPLLGRFISADTVVPEPGNPQNLNRYAYGLNNPLRFSDPTGHWVYEETDPYAARNLMSEIWKSYGIAITSRGSTPSIQELGWTSELLSQYPAGKVGRGVVSQIQWRERDPVDPDIGGYYCPEYRTLYVYEIAASQKSAIAFGMDSPEKAFKYGVLAHELTHAVQWTNPQTGEQYDRTSMESSPLMRGYGSIIGYKFRPGRGEWQSPGQNVPFPVRSTAVEATLNAPQTKLYPANFIAEDMALAVSYLGAGIPMGDRGTFLQQQGFFATSAFIPAWR